MIVETVVTTLDEDGQANFAAMGVVWGEERLVIRPYVRTRTFRNLVRAREAVVNVTDDVLVFAKSALSRERFPEPPRRARPRRRSSPTRVTGARSPSRSVGARAPPAEAVAPTLDARRGGGGGSPFAGLCRAKHAVVEASILASRVRRLPRDEVLAAAGPPRPAGGQDGRAGGARGHGVHPRPRRRRVGA